MDIKRLKSEQEVLLARYRHHNDREALDQLIRSLEPLIQKVARSFNHEKPADLLHIGRIGAFYAVRNYDPRKASLQTYVVRSVRTELLNSLREHIKERTSKMVQYDEEKTVASNVDAPSGWRGYRDMNGKWVRTR